MDYDYPVRCRDLPAMAANCRVERGITGNLFIREQRIELFLVKIVNKNSMTGFA